MRSMARLAIIGWFRSIEASGIERMPADGPALVVANHDGGFLDPVLLPAALPRFPRSLAIGDPVADAACPFVWVARAIPCIAPPTAPLAGTWGVRGLPRGARRRRGGGDLPGGRASDDVRPHGQESRTALGVRTSGAEGPGRAGRADLREQGTAACARPPHPWWTTAAIGADLRLAAALGGRASRPCAAG